MIKALICGGMGDSLIGFVKLQSKFSIEEIKNNIEITHVDIYNILFKSIANFYKSQEINYQLLKIDSWDWLKNQQENYDIIIADNSWNGNTNNSYLRNKINPEIKYYHLPNIDIVLHPVAGRNMNRRIPFDDIFEFCKNTPLKDICIIGWIEKQYETQLLTLSNVNTFLNESGTLIDILNLVCSCNIYIGNEGFSFILANIMKKNVYTRSLHNNNIADPTWNYTIINNLNSIII